MGGPGSGRRPEWVGAKLRKLIRLYNGGASTTELGKMLGITRQRVRHILLKNNVKMRKRGE